jgi:hypothetical protein
MLFFSSTQFFNLVYSRSATNDAKFWERKDLIRAELQAKGVKGLINVDDGITAFLLDFPNIHGFAFATDVEAQKAFREGKMLSLATSRGVNAITGYGYLPPITNKSQVEGNLAGYFKESLAWPVMSAEADKFEFSLVYYDEELKLPFIVFRPKAL